MIKPIVVFPYLLLKTLIKQNYFTQFTSALILLSKMNGIFTLYLSLVFRLALCCPANPLNQSFHRARWGLSVNATLSLLGDSTVRRANPLFLYWRFT